MTNLFENTNESTIFQDKKPLDPEVTPDRDELVCREEEINELVSHFKDLIDYKTAENLLITGDTGVGKTATTKTVLSDLRTMMDDARTNFREIYMTDMQNERNVLRKVSKKLDLAFYGSSDLEEYYDRLGEKLIEEDLTVVIVMDEVDKLFEKDHGNSLFKRLLEVRNRVNSADTGYLLLVSITNNVKTPDFFDPRVESRHGTNSVHFPSYNALELKEILAKRAEKAYTSVS
jgi:cell division control protein 6